MADIRPISEMKIFDISPRDAFEETNIFEEFLQIVSIPNEYYPKLALSSFI